MDPWNQLPSAVDEENTSEISESSQGFDDNFKPYLKMNDSGSYISTLETKLERMRVDSDQLTSKNMVEDAGKKKDDHMSNFICRREDWVAWDEVNLATVNATTEYFWPFLLRLKLQPEKCALSTEELQSLTKADQLNSINQDLTQSSDQNNDLDLQEDTKPA